MTGTQLSMAVPLLKLGLGDIPDLPADDGLMVIGDGNHFFFAVVVLLGMGQIVWRKGLFLGQIAHILFVLEYLDNVAVGPVRASVIGLIARFPQFPGDHGSPLLLHGVFMEDQSRDFGPLRVDDEFSVLHIITQHRSSKDHSPFHLPSLPPFDAGRSLSAFLLRNAAHDGQTQFSVRFQGADAIVHKQNAYSKGFQFTGKRNRVQNIS